MEQRTLDKMPNNHKPSKDTSDDKSPLFESWNSWYILVVIVNTICLLAVYFYFKSF